MSKAFRLVLQAREKLYQSGIFRTLRLNHPVVSVGNLTVGGTGKTPLVIALAEGLRDRGFRPVILSRGYGRISKGVMEVGSNPAEWEKWGDEPFLMKRRLGNVPVVVGANRYEAGILAEQKRLGDIFHSRRRISASSSPSRCRYRRHRPHRVDCRRSLAAGRPLA